MAFFRRKLIFIPLLFLLLVGAGLWWQRTAILSWYALQQLAEAGDDDRDVWVQRAASLDTAILPGLLALLERDDDRACANAEATLLVLLERWGADDPRATGLVEQARERFARCSAAGRGGVLRVPIWVLRQSAQSPAALVASAGHLLEAAVQAVGDQPRLFGHILELAAALSERVELGQCHDVCTDLALRGLAHVDPAERVRAVNLALKLAKRSDPELMQSLIPLLRDAAAEVRRAALVALAPARDLLTDDDLLPLLHDADADVRRLCELALRSRGLQENHIRLARLISDRRPRARLQVLEHLKKAPELEPSVWLRRLTEDSDRAVRAAAVRAACRDFRVDLGDRIRQMAQHDPSDTVRRIVGIYLQQPR